MPAKICPDAYSEPQGPKGAQVGIEVPVVVTICMSSSLAKQVAEFGQESMTPLQIAAAAKRLMILGLVGVNLAHLRGALRYEKKIAESDKEDHEGGLLTSAPNAVELVSEDRGQDG